MFAEVRKQARGDPFFVSCQQLIPRRLYSWRPAELVDICQAFSKQTSVDQEAEQLLGRLLWRVKRLLPCLAGQQIVRLLEAYTARRVREHDPKSTDLFIAAGPLLTDAVGHFSPAELGKISTFYRVFNIRDGALFDALSGRLAQLLDNLGARDKMQRKVVFRTTALVSAAMSFLTSCGRLNLRTPELQNIFFAVSCRIRGAADVARMTALVQLAAKFGYGSHPEVGELWHGVNSALQRSPVPTHSSKGYASQVVFGQLLLALVFDEAACRARDAALVSLVGAVQSSYGSSLAALDERLTRQLHIAELACELERPQAWALLNERKLLPFLNEVKGIEQQLISLPKCSSQQHFEVSGALSALHIRHNMEEELKPYVADVRVRSQTQLIEIDGPMHFVGRSNRYDLKSVLKHRLLTKQGWQVLHIAWYDWPVQFHSRLNFLSRLLQMPAPPALNLCDSPPAESRFSEVREGAVV